MLSFFPTEEEIKWGLGEISFVMNICVASNRYLFRLVVLLLSSLNVKIFHKIFLKFSINQIIAEHLTKEEMRI